MGDADDTTRTGPTRRQALALIGLSAVTSIAGCSTNDSGTSTQAGTTETTDSTTEWTETTESDSEFDVEKSTSESIVTLVDAIAEFRASLSADLLSEASFEVGDVEQFSWTNLPAGTDGDRGGVRMGSLSDEQVDLFYQAMDPWLSDEGDEKVTTITQDVEAYLEEQNANMWSPDYYHVAMFGDPEEDAVWGFQIDGHHMAINFVVYGDQASIVPAFIGSEPAQFDGSEVLANERDLAFQLMQNLDDDQQSEAIQEANRGLKIAAGNNGVDTNSGVDYSQFEGIGLQASDMTDGQRQMLKNLVQVYVYNLEEELAADWWADIESSFDDTYFAWIGDTTRDSAIYYRVYNPAVWIEYNNEGGLGGGGGNFPGGDGDMPNGTAPNGTTTNGTAPEFNGTDGGPDGNATGGDAATGTDDSNTDHVHTITRAPNGGDYGGLTVNTGNEQATLLDHYYSIKHHAHDILPLDYSYE